ncbi:hypothetical protein ACN28I_46425 [Archangium gephyra]|uniref:hypothetical protein n=1 Tax=Archangium gephyra TaxID=48 RepID=UPI003B78FD8E
MNSPQPESPPPLKVLVEQARSPNAGRAEVDALLRGLAQPPRPGEEAHERAELLRRILDDKRLRSFIGSQGRQVHGAAAQAMVALGEPYSQQLSPQDRVAMRAAETRASQSPVSQSRAAPSRAEPADSQDEAQEPLAEGISLRQSFGRMLLMVVGAVELYVILFHIAPRQGLPLVPLMFSVGTTFVPAWLAASPKAVAHRGRHFSYLGLVLFPCAPMALGAVAFFVLGSSKPTSTDYLFLYVPLAMVAARLVAAGCLYTRPRK